MTWHTPLLSGAATLQANGAATATAAATQAPQAAVGAAASSATAIASAGQAGQSPSGLSQAASAGVGSCVKTGQAQASSASASITAAAAATATAQVAAGAASASTPASAPSVSAHAIGTASPGTSVSSAAVSTTGGSGSVFLAFVAAGTNAPGAAPTVSDNKGNTWTSLKAFADLAGSPTFRLGVFACQGGAGGSGHIVTATATGGVSSYWTVWFVELTGCASSALYGAPSWIDTTAGSVTGASITTSGPSTLLTISMPVATGTQSWTLTDGSRVVDAQANGSLSYPGQLSARQYTTAGSYAASYTHTPSTRVLTMTVGVRAQPAAATSAGASTQAAALAAGSAAAPIAGAGASVSAAQVAAGGSSALASAVAAIPRPATWRRRPRPPTTA